MFTDCYMYARFVMDKCPYCGNETIKMIRMLGLHIYHCIFKGCKYRLTIDLMNKKVRTDKDN